MNIDFSNILINNLIVTKITNSLNNANQVESISNEPVAELLKAARNKLAEEKTASIQLPEDNEDVEASKLAEDLESVKVSKLAENVRIEKEAAKLEGRKGGSRKNKSIANYLFDSDTNDNSFF